MSYDISLWDPDTNSVAEFEEKHNIAGGTFIAGGTKEVWLNVTYNYSNHFKLVLGKDGIRTIYGLTGEESIPILKNAISKLNDDVSSDYWEPTEGNAKEALENLLYLAEKFQGSIWSGD